MFLNVAKSLFIVSLHFLKDIKSHTETNMKFMQGEDKLQIRTDNKAELRERNDNTGLGNVLNQNKVVR